VEAVSLLGVDTLWVFALHTHTVREGGDSSPDGRSAFSHTSMEGPVPWFAKALLEYLHTASYSMNMSVWLPKPFIKKLVSPRKFPEPLVRGCPSWIWHYRIEV
jgi:hypothetical protein